MSLALDLIAESQTLRFRLSRAGKEEDTLSLLELEHLARQIIRDADLIRTLPSGCVLSFRITAAIPTDSLLSSSHATI